MKRRELLIGGAAVASSAGVVTAQTGARYPAPAGEPGAPFADPNLKLAVLSGLLDIGAIDLGEPWDLAAHLLGRPWDYETEGYQLIPEALDYLYRYPLPADLLARAQHLDLDGGSAIYEYVWFFWDGESDDFTVSSLAGLDQCPNLRMIRIVSMLSGRLDLRSFLGFPHLEELFLGVEADHVAALLDMPALRKVSLLDNRLYDEVMTPGHPTREVMDRLKARGVRVWVHWVSYVGMGPPAFE